MMNISEIQEENMSNLTTSASNEASVSSTGGGEIYPPSYTVAQAPPAKKRRNQPGHPDPGSEVIALSPRTLMATNRFVCEICSKGFQREQNLQLHRRGHNLPWKLKQRNGKDVRKKVYICPVTTCVHHEASRALGDLTGIKKHFCRKHGEKKWKCEKCSKKYAVQSDWKAHSKTCGTREYKCDCGTLFSRRDGFTTHRAFCDALAEESANSISGNSLSSLSHHINLEQIQSHFSIKKEQQHLSQRPPWLACPSSIFQDHDHHPNPNPNMGPTTTVPSFHHPPPHMSATALLQKAAEMGSTPPSPAGVFSRLPHHAAHVSADESGTAGFGLKLSSRDQFINGLAPFGNKAAAGGTATACTTNPSSPSLLVHEMLINNPGFRHHDDFSFAGILNKKAQETLDFHATLDHFSTSNGCNDDGMMTRDFLGLRPLSQNDILNFAALSNCINTSSCNEHQSQTERSWQG